MNGNDIHIALFHPDIPGNTGAILRIAACLGLTVDLIEPAGFDLSDRALKRAGMDYLEIASLNRHTSWEAFERWRCDEGRRLILFTTTAAVRYTAFCFRDGDILLFGCESSGAPEAVHKAADHRLVIPMREKARSLNVAVAAAMACGEALRQMG
ncbi:tRNA (cytidine(34)-2'-O)-methyltransferase [Chelativorans salis]|uniref:tRNA (cytidine(34)-2'-O)-methyltransferase n=1 Tax=Chelativorans salis TaxID=2978478 RepID=A0ABT2LLT2_9HYPH|nr:tRNA (cytidine(34)-2'-O)-methyltransferase [Chelativorans sp. EGI FJ00035]MCT7374787.1 tRNA (cytidine(34)-2'-O)-methyltransferase [Chelativorans sp. EGI FJ00035]